MTPPTVSLSQKGKRRSHTTLASPGLSYFGTHASTSVMIGLISCSVSKSVASWRSPVSVSKIVERFPCQACRGRITWRILGSTWRPTRRFFLGEFGTAADAASLAALNTMLAYIQQNGDVWAYATWWGAGDRWGNYFMSIEPTDYATEKPQMVALAKYHESGA
jgi:hypothetical protein